jgi:hypothetical protein
MLGVINMLYIELGILKHHDHVAGTSTGSITSVWVAVSVGKGAAAAGARPRARAKRRCPVPGVR